MIDGESGVDLSWMPLRSLRRAVTDGASLAHGGAFPSPSQCDEHCGVFVAVRDCDYYLNLRCLYLTAVFASFFCSSCGDFGTWKCHQTLTSRSIISRVASFIITIFWLDAQSNSNSSPTPSASALTHKRWIKIPSRARVFGTLNTVCASCGRLRLDLAIPMGSMV